MCGSVWQCVAGRGSALPVPLRCAKCDSSVLHYDALCCDVLQYVTSAIAPCVAMCCSVLRCVTGAVALRKVRLVQQLDGRH